MNGKVEFVLTVKRMAGGRAFAGGRRATGLTIDDDLVGRRGQATADRRRDAAARRGVAQTSTSPSIKV